MRKKSKARLKPALKCELCEGSLKLKKVIPAAHIFPELRTYGCVECGALRSVEDEAELHDAPGVPRQGSPNSGCGPDGDATKQQPPRLSVLEAARHCSPPIAHPLLQGRGGSALGAVASTRIHCQKIIVREFALKARSWSRCWIHR